MHYEFRPFNINTDAELIREFLLDTQKLTGTIPDNAAEDGAAYVSAIVAAQERDPGSCAVLQENGVVVGFVDIQISKKNSGAGFIRFDYIVPHRRRKGLGRKLIDYALAHAKNAGCDRVYLDVAPSNHSAIAFYEKHDWQFTGESNGSLRRMDKAL